MNRFSGLTRREFLKLISLAPVGIYSRQLGRLAKGADPARPNIIILVFDAWSQRHVSLYGYPRPTMPNLESFADSAAVYHHHYSTAVFTVPGTSSLLTGLHPWSHRAFQLGAGISAAHIPHTIFSALSSTHATMAYTQNKLADFLLYQLEADLDQHVENWSYNVQSANLYGAPVFKKDPGAAFVSLDDNLIQEGAGYDSSLFLGPLVRLGILKDRQRARQQYGEDYPHGLPESLHGIYQMNDLVEGAIQLLKGIQEPTLAYLHFLPPHAPYAPRRTFFEKFMDGWNPAEKPIHELSEKKISPENLHLQRRFYDEFIANWDDEVARLFRFLKESGLTENSYIIITADHGELFERGELGHNTKMLFDPVIHVPLVVSRPGQTQREDIYAYTSSVDLLPTLAHLTGNPIPSWSEGQLLPGLGGMEDKHRSIFSMEARTNSSFTPLRNYSMSITRDGYRLVYYRYPKKEFEKYEFYDLEADDEEMNDLYPSSPSLAKEMRAELMQKISEVNRPFERNGM